jgi:hypothetical protein
LPTQLYNDRPLGSILEFCLYRTFGLNYSHQLAFFLMFHFGNCILAYVLFRRLGVRIWLSLALVGLIGSLSTTGQTATYLGASFDVLCTFFLLGSTVLILQGSRLTNWLSALFYLLALRSKEFGIVIPILLTVLVMWNCGGGVNS